MKKTKVNTVTDEKGNQRFHGAFTGGFNAGYYNTVGSEEGFKPKQFISSRQKRAEKVSNSVRDYIDDEDGLLGKNLETKDDVDTFKTNGEKRGGDSLLKSKFMSDLMIVPNNTKGKKLLQLMGWKQGQGVGPRSYTNKSGIHSSIDASMVPQSSLLDGKISFAPKESDHTNVIIPEIKDDFYGVGFSNDNELFDLKSKKRQKMDTNTNNVYNIDDIFNSENSGVLQKKTGKIGGFKELTSGFLVDEDGEDLVYNQNERNFAGNITNYYIEEPDLNEDVELEIDKKLKGFEGIVRENEEIPIRCPSDGKRPLEGFQLMIQGQIKPKHFPAPKVPESFNPVHSFTTENKTENDKSYSRFGMGNNANQAVKNRSLMINDREEKKISSIFDLLPPESKARLAQHTKKQVTVEDTKEENKVVELQAELHVAANPKERPLLTNPALLNSTFAGLSEAFKNRFATSSSTSSVSAQDTVATMGTGLATAQELQERKKKLLEQQESEAKEKEDSSSTLKSGSSSTLKRKEREVISWAPAPLLCKRFNVKVPEVSKIEKNTKMDNKKEETADTFVERLLNPFNNPPQNPPVTGIIKENKIPETKISDKNTEEFQKFDPYLNSEKKVDISVFKNIFEDHVLEPQETENETENEKLVIKGPSLPTEVINEVKNKETSNFNDLEMPMFIPKKDRIGSKKDLTSEAMGNKNIIGFKRKSKNSVATGKRPQPRLSFMDDGNSDDDDEGNDVVSTRKKTIEEDKNVRDSDENEEEKEKERARELRRKRTKEKQSRGFLGFTAKEDNSSTKEQNNDKIIETQKSIFIPEENLKSNEINEINHKTENFQSTSIICQNEEMSKKRKKAVDFFELDENDLISNERDLLNGKDEINCNEKEKKEDSKKHKKHKKSHKDKDKKSQKKEKHKKSHKKDKDRKSRKKVKNDENSDSTDSSD